MSINKGDIVEIELADLANGGDCVGRYDDLAVFVPGGVPGELVKIRITEKKKNYARGEIVEVLRRAPERVEAECPVSGICGGCQLQHIAYEKQLEYKRKMMKDLLERIARLEDPEVQPVFPAPHPFFYRNKAQFPLARDSEGKIIAGFYERGSHEIVPLDSCQIQHPLINRTMKKTLEILNDYPTLTVYNEKTHKGLLRHLVIRTGVCTNQVLLVLVTSGKELPNKEEIAERVMKEIPELAGVLQNINPERSNVVLGKETGVIAGRDYYLDYIGNVRFAISINSFFQVNTLQTRNLYDFVVDFAGLTGKETVIDAYCGIGSISLYLAERAGEVIGIEEVPAAIEDAGKNARLNDINNCRFITGRVEDKLPELLAEGKKPDLIVFDPPRKGLAREVIEAVIGVKPEKIVYVSCNPATLARDLALFKEDYDVRKVQPVDMFPNTYHVECVTLMSRIEK